MMKVLVFAIMAQVAAQSEGFLYCNPDFVEWKNSCYLSVSTPRTWAEAKGECKNHGGDLITIEDEAEHIFASELLLQTGAWNSGWTNHNDIDEEGEWRSDSQVSAYTRFCPRQPDNWRGAEDCVELVARYKCWNDVNCKAKRNFVCEARPACPLGYSLWRDSCYKVYGRRSTWNDAKEQCRTRGGDLITIEDDEENEFAIELLDKKGAETHNIMFSMMDGMAPAVWTNLNDKQREGEWRSGSTVAAFKHFCENEPNNWGGSEDCVMLISGKYKCWNDNSCMAKIGFICELHLGGEN